MNAINSAYLHLVVTHVPVVGTFFGLCLFFYALCKRSEELKRAGLLALFFAALLALPAYLSGQPAVDLLKRMMPGMTMDTCDQHMEVGILALVGSMVLGVASLAGLLLFRKGKPLPAYFAAVVLILGLISFGVMAWTANLGARIRHNEIRNFSADAARAHRIYREGLPQATQTAVTKVS
jgi:uncharacterized membrane protein